MKIPNQKSIVEIKINLNHVIYSTEYKTSTMLFSLS
jgi:hypothetical protein